MLELHETRGKFGTDKMFKNDKIVTKMMERYVCLVCTCGSAEEYILGLAAMVRLHLLEYTQGLLD